MLGTYLDRDVEEFIDNQPVCIDKLQYLHRKEFDRKVKRLTRSRHKYRSRQKYWDDCLSSSWRKAEKENYKDYRLKSSGNPYKTAARYRGDVYFMDMLQWMDHTSRNKESRGGWMAKEMEKEARSFAQTDHDYERAFWAQFEELDEELWALAKDEDWQIMLSVLSSNEENFGSTIFGWLWINPR